MGLMIVKWSQKVWRECDFAQETATYIPRSDAQQKGLKPTSYPAILCGSAPCAIFYSFTRTMLGTVRPLQTLTAAGVSWHGTQWPSCRVGRGLGQLAPQRLPTTQRKVYLWNSRLQKVRNNFRNSTMCGRQSILLICLQWREKAILLSPSTFKNIQVVQIVKPHERTETSAAHGRSPSLLPRIRPLSPESFRDRGSLAGLPLNLWYHPKPWPWHTNIHERSQGWSSWKGVDSTFWLVNVFWWVAVYPQPTNNQGETTLFPEHMGAPAIHRMPTMQHVGDMSSATRSTN